MCFEMGKCVLFSHSFYFRQSLLAAGVVTMQKDDLPPDVPLDFQLAFRKGFLLLDFFCFAVKFITYPKGVFVDPLELSVQSVTTEEKRYSNIESHKFLFPLSFLTLICQPLYYDTPISEFIKDGAVSVGEVIASLWFKRKLPEYATRFIGKSGQERLNFPSIPFSQY